MFPTSPMKDGAAASMEQTEFQQATFGHGNNRRSAIDYSKFKTKMCRHFMMGLPCPFEDRCAFAHGTGDQFRTSPMKSSAAAAAAPPSYSAFISNVSDSPVDSRSDTPPAYPSRYRYEPYSSSGIVFEA